LATPSASELPAIALSSVWFDRRIKLNTLETKAVKALTTSKTPTKPGWVAHRPSANFSNAQSYPGRKSQQPSRTNHKR